MEDAGDDKGNPLGTDFLHGAAFSTRISQHLNDFFLLIADFFLMCTDDLLVDGSRM